jgi:hypothetical protein
MGCLVLLMLAAQPEPLSLAVAGLSAEGFKGDEVAILLSDLRAAVGSSKRYRLVTLEEMGAIDEELVRQLSGGCNEASCVAELARAAEADFVVNGRLSRLGKKIILGLKLTRVSDLKTLATSRSESESIEAIQDDLERSARMLLSEDLGQADLRIASVMRDGDVVTGKTVLWQGKVVGKTPFRGPVGAGKGRIEIRQGKTSYGGTLLLRPNTKKAIVIRLGRNEAGSKRLANVFAGSLALGLGVPLGVISVRESLAQNEPDYSVLLVSDALIVLGLANFYWAWTAK